MLVPRYDTGSWSLYDQFGESSLSYHELLTEFLQHLCERTRKGPPLGAQAPLTEDGIYCTTAQRFTADVSTPPTISLISRTLRGGTRAGVMVALSKISRVRLTVKRGARVVWTVAATVPAGTPAAVVADARGGGQLHGHAQRERPRGEHRERRGHDRRSRATRNDRLDPRTRPGTGGCARAKLAPVE